MSYNLPHLTFHISRSSSSGSGGFPLHSPQREGSLCSLINWGRLQLGQASPEQYARVCLGYNKMVEVRTRGLALVKDGHDQTFHGDNVHPKSGGFIETLLFGLCRVLLPTCHLLNGQLGSTNPCQQYRIGTRTGLLLRNQPPLIIKQ